MRLPRSSELTPCAADTEVADKTRAGPWRVYARTVVGPIHLADRLPNQDAVDWRPRRRRSSADCLSAAVADGHGHRLHLRSAVGARLATSSLVAELERISQRAASGLEHPLLERLVQVDLIQGLTSSWRQEVAADLRAHPMTTADYATLASALPEEELRRATLLPLVLYGSTVLGAAVTADHVLVGGIGDGDVVVVDGYLNAFRPLPDAGSPFANVTASLCESDPAQSWRAAALRRTNDRRRPIIVLIATDGLTGFFGVGTALCERVRELAETLVAKGDEQFERGLWNLVGEAQRGIGDDATLLTLYEEDAVERLRRWHARRAAIPGRLSGKPPASALSASPHTAAAEGPGGPAGPAPADAFAADSKLHDAGRPL